MTISFTKSTLSEEDWLEYLSYSKTEKANRFLEDGTPSFKINTEENTVTIREDLSLIERIAAFFQLIFLEIFSSATQITEILPESWNCFWDGKRVQHFTYKLNTNFDFPFPAEIGKTILRFLSISDLLSFSLVQKHIPFGLDSIWKEYAIRLNCPITENLLIKKQVKAFIAELRDKGNFVLNHRRLSSYINNHLELSKNFYDKIQELVLSDEFEDLVTLDRALEAMDSVIFFLQVRQRLSGTAGHNPGGFVEMSYLSFAKLLALPNQLEEWFKDNQYLFSNVGGLHLEDLTSIPFLIKYLPNLTSLSLDNNFITDLPKEIWDLKELESLYVGCKLKKLSSDIGKLKKLELLSFGGENTFTSFPKEIFEITTLQLLSIHRNQPEDLLPNSLRALVLLNRPQDLTSWYYNLDPSFFKMLESSEDL